MLRSERKTSAGLKTKGESKMTGLKTKGESKMTGLKRKGEKDDRTEDTGRER